MDAQRMARTGGWVAIATGLLGVGAGLLLLLLPPSVPPDDFSYPLSHSWFVVVQVAFFVHHVGMAFALWAFWRAGAAGGGPLAAIGGWSAVVAVTLLGCWELVAISGAGLPYPTEQTAWLDAGYGTLSSATGVALVLLGFAAARSGVLSGVGRWIVLLTGIYVFVPMTPALFAGFVVGRTVLTVWLLLFAVIGVVLVRWAGAPARDVGPTPEWAPA